MEKDQLPQSASGGANTIFRDASGHTAFPTAAAPKVKPTRQSRRTTTTYDRVTRGIGLTVAMLLMVALWVTGSYLTLTWLSSVGVRLADAGLAPVAWLLQLPNPHAARTHWLWGLFAWCIPAAISGAEIGLYPRRVAHPLLWLIWAAFLAVDAGTTAAGVVQVLDADPTSAWLIGLAVGVALALLPEKGARVIWQLLREG